MTNNVLNDGDPIVATAPEPKRRTPRTNAKKRATKSQKTQPKPTSSTVKFIDPEFYNSDNVRNTMTDVFVDLRAYLSDVNPVVLYTADNTQTYRHPKVYSEAGNKLAVPIAPNERIMLKTGVIIKPEEGKRLEIRDNRVAATMNGLMLCANHTPNNDCEVVISIINLSSKRQYVTHGQLLALGNIY